VSGQVALCQGCLRVHPVEALIPCANDPPGLCPTCGDQTCSCEGCLESIPFLEKGEWASANIQPRHLPHIVSWTTDGGLVLR
jgi:hypothetical protein